MKVFSVNVVAASLLKRPVRVIRSAVRSASGGRLAVPDWLSEAVPDWLAEVMRPKKAPVPWPDMIRAVLAIWVPLAAGFVTGRRELALLPAMGGLLSVMIDTGGPYRQRVRRIGTAAVFGGAAGLAAGTVLHGRGWVAVAAIVVIAGVSGVVSRLGATGSATGLQLLVYSSLGLGPIGLLRPWWHTALEFLAGAVWAVALIAPSWLLSPRSAEQRAVAAVYHALAADLRAIGTPAAAAARRAATSALNTAYDTLLTGRASASGRNERSMRLMAILNASHQMTEAVPALRAEGERPPPWVTDTIDRLADAIARGPESGAPLPLIPPQWSASPGALALRDSVVAVSLKKNGDWTPPSAPPTPPDLRSRLRGRAGRLAEQLMGGRIAWTFTARLMICIGVAAAASEVLPLQRSYWVVLTTAIVLKPDYGSVFARALQRGTGTIVGAAGGAAILAVVPYGLWLLLPFGVLAALLPYGKSRNFVLTAGYAPWPAAWQAHLPAQFAATLRAVAAYMDEGLVTAWAAGGRPDWAAGGRPGPVPDPDPRSGRPGAGPAAPRPPAAPGSPAAPPWRSRLRRRAARSLADLRAEYQRTMSEPPAVSRRASAWWPAVVGLEEALDATTTAVVAIGRGAAGPAPDAVHRLTGALRAVADAIEAELPPRCPGELPSDPALAPVTAAVRSVLALLTRGEPRSRGEAATVP